MRSTTYIQLDMQRPRLITVYAVQDDQLSRWIHADLTDGGVAWTPPAGAAMMIRYAKPDGTVGFYDSLEDNTPAYEISGSGVDFGLAAQSLTVPGIVSLEISFYTEDAERLSAFQFLMHVERNPVTDGELESNDYFNILAEQIAGLLAATVHPPQIDPDTKNWLIWDENENGYVDSGYSSVGLTGPGLRVQSSTTEYLSSSSGTTHPDEDDPGWSATPSVTPGTYLWSKITVTCVDDGGGSGGSAAFAIDANGIVSII